MSALPSRLSLSDRRDRDDSPEGRNPSRPSGQASKPCSLPTRFGHPPTALCDRRKAEIVVISDACPKSPVLFDSPAGLARQRVQGRTLAAPQPRELTPT